MELSESKRKAYDAMRALNLTIEAKFVPFSQSRNKAEKSKTLNWVVTLLRNGRAILTTDYSAGIAHCPGYNAQKGDTPAHYERNMRVAYEVENGRHAFHGKGSILPDRADVLYSLIMDASVLDAGGFEDWTSEYGYDTDSRKAESLYRECLELALKLRSSIGEAGLQRLRDAFEGY